jgi:propanol-preferring alcohol dehydrogenase
MEVTSFWAVYKSIRIQGSYVGNRQDAIEALDIAADGRVKVHFELKKLKDLKECVKELFSTSLHAASKPPN